MKYLLDTNILIYYLNGDETAIKFIDKNIDNCSISIICVIFSKTGAKLLEVDNYSYYAIVISDFKKNQLLIQDL